METSVAKGSITVQADDDRQSFRVKLVDIYNKRKANQRSSSLYLSIEQKIKDTINNQNNS